MRSLGETLELTPALRRLTFDASSVAVVGEKVPDEVFDDFMVLAKTATDRSQAAPGHVAVGAQRAKT